MGISGLRGKVLGVVVLLLFGIIMYFMIASSTVSANRTSHTELVITGAEKWKEQMLLFPKLVENAHYGNWSTSGKGSLDLLYLEDCWQDKDWYRMYADPYCTFLWMRSIEHADVRSLDLILAVVTNAEGKSITEQVKSNQNGGMRAYLASDLGLRAYWKPCTYTHLPSNSETFQSEIVAYWVDQILGFHRTPVVVPRYFTYKELLHLGYEAMNRTGNEDREAIVKLRSIVDRCGTDDYNVNGNFGASNTGAEGAMVGWSNFPIISLDKSNSRIRKKVMVNMFSLNTEEKFNMIVDDFKITRSSHPDDISWALENIAVNMFALLMGNSKKFEHSVFMLSRSKSSPSVAAPDDDDDTEYGPFSYIDNDRSSWNSNFLSLHNLHHHPLTRLCKFPLKIATHLLLLKPSNSSSLTLGKLVLQISEIYKDMKNKPLFTESNVYWMDHRAKFLTDAIENCVAEYGFEDVLIPEPWLKEYSQIHLLADVLSR